VTSFTAAKCRPKKESSDGCQSDRENLAEEAFLRSHSILFDRERWVLVAGDWPAARKLEGLG
jgi:hypothetical protein